MTQRYPSYEPELMFAGRHGSPPKGRLLKSMTNSSLPERDRCRCAQAPKAVRHATASSVNLRPNGSILVTGNRRRSSNSSKPCTPSFAGTTRRGSRCPWARAVLSTTEEAWASWFNQSKKSAAPPVAQFYFGADRQPNALQKSGRHRWMTR